MDSEAADYYFSHDDGKKSCKTSNILRFPPQQNLDEKKKRGGSGGGGGSGTQKIQSSRWIIRKSCVNTWVVVRLWGLISWFGIMTFGFAEETAFVIPTQHRKFCCHTCILQKLSIYPAECLTRQVFHVLTTALRDPQASAHKDVFFFLANMRLAYQ